MVDRFVSRGKGIRPNLMQALDFKVWFYGVCFPLTAQSLGCLLETPLMRPAFPTCIIMRKVWIFLPFPFTGVATLV